MNTVARVSLAVVCTAVLLTTGCSEQEVTPEESTPSSSEPAETQPPPVADAIELRAEEFLVFAGTDVVATLPLDDSTATVVELSRLLGPPSTESVEPESPADYCTFPHTVYDWGDAIRLVDYKPDFDTLTDYEVRIFTPTVDSASAEPVALRGAGGVAIGDDISAQLEASPGMWDSYELDGVTHSILILERGFVDLESDDGVIFGVAAFADDGIVDVIGSPVPIFSSADC